MNNSIKNKNIKDLKSEILDWNLIQAEMKKKLGIDIYETILKKGNATVNFGTIEMYKSIFEGLIHFIYFNE